MSTSMRAQSDARHARSERHAGEVDREEEDGSLGRAGGGCGCCCRVRAQTARGSDAVREEKEVGRGDSGRERDEATQRARACDGQPERKVVGPLVKVASVRAHAP